MEIFGPEEKLVTKGYICDICNKNCCHDEHATLYAQWGYYSNNRDGDTSECHMCEGCFVKVVDFIHSVGGKVRTKEIDSRREEGRDYVIDRTGDNFLFSRDSV